MHALKGLGQSRSKDLVQPEWGIDYNSLMKRIVISKPGGYEALQLVEEAEPRPGPGQLKVAVRAIGINYADVIVRLGHYAAAKGQYPITPGFEFAGIVAETGPDVDGFKTGDRVFGVTRFGAYASSLIVEPKQIWPCPQGWSFEDCAGFPGVFLTAYHALFRTAKVESGETLLVHSAAGGVGTALLQLGKIAGCRSIGVVGSAHKVDVCKRLGADLVIDRSSQDIWKEGRKFAPNGFDAIFDANGVTTLKPGFENLAHGGRLVVYGFAEIMPRGKSKPNILQLAWNYLRVPKFSPLDMTTTNRAVMGFNVVFLYHKFELATEGMNRMLKWIEDGRIRKVPVTSFPLEKVADAHKAIESGTTVGKLVLTTS